MITVKSILIERLKQLGADGLCCDDCGCGLDDLGVCERGAQLDCVPARHVKTTPESHARYAEYPDGYYVPLLPEVSPVLCLWDAYQQHPTYENMTRWLKHRAYKLTANECEKQAVEAASAIRAVSA